MAHAWTFETAAAFWEAHRDDPEGAWDGFASAEAFLLDHTPGSSGEAARMLEVVVAQAGDRRSDERDMGALKRLGDYLHRVGANSRPEPAADPPGPESGAVGLGAVGEPV